MLGLFRVSVLRRHHLIVSYLFVDVFLVLGPFLQRWIPISATFEQRRRGCRLTILPIVPVEMMSVELFLFRREAKAAETTLIFTDIELLDDAEIFPTKSKRV